MSLKQKILKKIEVAEDLYVYNQRDIHEDVKEAVLEFKEYHVSQYLGKWMCDDCNKIFHIIYFKTNIRLCRECLIKKVFGDYIK